MSPALSSYNDTLANFRLREQLTSLRTLTYEQEQHITKLIQENSDLRKSIRGLIEASKVPSPPPQAEPQPDFMDFMVRRTYGIETRLRPATQTEIDASAGVATLRARTEELVRQRGELETKNHELTLQLNDWKRQHWEGPL